MKIQSIFENNYHINHKTEIFDFCKQAFEEKSKPSHVNMWQDDWENDTSTFPYLLYKSNRFTDNNGDIFLILDDNNKILAMSGVNISDFDPNVALGGVRTWLNKAMRGKFIVGRHLVPMQLKWAKDRNMKTMTLMFNDYNKQLIPYFKRSGLGIKKQRNPNSMFYNGLFQVNFPVTINYTKQWVIYHKIDEDYIPDWESIRYVENE
jgi:hypothetical protein